MSRSAVEGTVALLGNLFAWFASTEQIWFPIAGAVMKWVRPMYDLPDLRGPFAALTLMYIGLRLGDLWEKRGEDLKDTL